jgi:hypothetical protein
METIVSTHMCSDIRRVSAPRKQPETAKAEASLVVKQVRKLGSVVAVDCDEFGKAVGEAVESHEVESEFEP